MPLATDEALIKTLGLIATFGGLGVILNILVVYIAVQIRGEHRQNEELLSSRRPPE